MGMAKMSKAQRAAILRAHENTTTSANSTAAFWSRGYVHATGSSLEVMERNGWITAGRAVTREGLEAAGVDMDAIHAEALEYVARAQHIAQSGVAHVRNNCPALSETQDERERRVTREFIEAMNAAPNTPAEDQCGCLRNPLGHSRAEHPVKREYSAQLGGYVVQDASGHWHREANTPAEARTGMSDRTAAALADVAYLRRAYLAVSPHETEALDRIEQALRQQ